MTHPKIVQLDTGGYGNDKKRPGEKAAEKAAGKKSAALVVFFSDAGEDYDAGSANKCNKCNIRVIAEYIREFTGADMFEIVEVEAEPYDMPDRDPAAPAKMEMITGGLPLYRGRVDNMEDYDTVFVGGPIWWGKFPDVMYTFFCEHNLDEKTIIPFTTNGGSGLRGVVEDLELIFPFAHVTGSKSFSDRGARPAREKVKAWIEGIAFP